MALQTAARWQPEGEERRALHCLAHKTVFLKMSALFMQSKVKDRSVLVLLLSGLNCCCVISRGIDTNVVRSLHTEPLLPPLHSTAQFANCFHWCSCERRQRKNLYSNSLSTVHPARCVGEEECSPDCCTPWHYPHQTPRLPGKELTSSQLQMLLDLTGQ